MAGLLRGRPYTFMREANRQAAGTNGSDGFGKLRFRRGTDGKTRQMLEDVREKRALDLKVEPIHGDIYTYWAFRDVLVHMKHVSEEATHSKVLHVGLICVMIVQILGPPAVLIWSLYAIDWSNARVGLGAWEYIPGSYHKGVSNFFSHLLSTLFLFVFILNGIYVIRDDKQKSEKIWYLVSVLEKDGSGVVNRTWLRVGAFINSWVVVISAICMGPCFMLSKSPKDIIFDAFALLFLFRLDDVNGDLGFLEEQWDSEKFGKLYEDVRSWEEKDQRAGSLESGQVSGSNTGSDDDVDNMCPATARGDGCHCSVYKTARQILLVLMVVVPAFFVFTEGVVPKHILNRSPEAHQAEWQAMQDRLQAMDAQVASMRAQLHGSARPPAP